MKEISSNIAITVLYDNNPLITGLEPSWGFSCLLEGLEKTLLFDTGSNPFLLLRNIKRLKINVKTLDFIFLSHMHWDHTGGLYAILEDNPDVTVVLLESFSHRYKEDMRKIGGKIIEVGKPVRICEQVFSTGELGTSIKEQSLLIRSKRGFIVITGCAHPGIIKILKKAKEIIKDEVLLVLGGFHLGAMSKAEIENIIANFKSLGVKYVGPCHCSGENAQELFQSEYCKKYIHIGTGKVININDLK